MVNQVGGGGLAREAILAAMRAQQQAGGAGALPGAPGMPDLGALQGPGATGPAAPVEGAGSFVEALQDGLREVDQSVRAAEALPEAVVRGEVDEFHDVALAIKQSDLSFRFALQVRNKLIDAYREVMRMSV